MVIILTNDIVMMKSNEEDFRETITGINSKFKEFGLEMDILKR